MLSKFFAVAAVALLGVFALPQTSQAVFTGLSFSSTGGTTLPNGTLEIAPGTTGSVSLFFSTDSTSHSANNFFCASPGCVFGFAPKFSGTGDSVSILTGNGVGVLNAFTTCDSPGVVGPIGGCQFGGGDSTSGQNGVNLLIGTFSFTGTIPGSQLILDTIDITEGDFFTTTVNGPIALATVAIPEPTTAVLLGAALAGLAGLRRRRTV